MIANGEWSQYKKFWLMYYKDDFPLDNFDNTQFQAEARKNLEMSVAWSNESIELWFLLHFEDYHADNGRKQYIMKLNTYFDYSKTREDLYDVLIEKGSLQDAKRRAKKMYQEFLDADISSMSAMVPPTRVYELISHPLFLIITGDAVRNNTNSVIGLPHIVASRLHTSCCICACNVKFMNLMFSYK